MTPLVVRAEATIENASPAIRRRRIESNNGMEPARYRARLIPVDGHDRTLMTILSR